MNTQTHTLILLLITMAACVLALKGSAATINDHQAIRAIIGEAANQGEEGMLAVACGIRNRRTLRGVYGLHAPHVDKQPQWVWRMAREAWQKSKHVDIVCGADHWENIKAFGKPKWANRMRHTITIKDHAFYKS